MTILIYILLGLVAGAIAKALMPGKQGGGILSTIILGVLGALLGGLLGNLLFEGEISLELSGNWFWSLVTAVVGALIVLAIYGATRGRSKA